ncbi:hypothetical protein ACHAPT_001432 [Fusarium lateritium]
MKPDDQVDTPIHLEGGPAGKPQTNFELIDNEVAQYVAETRVQIDEATNKRLKRMIDKRILIVMIVTYFTQSLDRGTMSFSSIMGIIEDANLAPNQYSWFTTIMYLVVLVVEYPENYILQCIPIAKWLSANIILWGVTLALHAAASNFAGLVVLRGFLGGFEAVCQPAFVLLSSTWYKKEEQASTIIYWVFAAKCWPEEDEKLMVERVRENRTGVQNRVFRKEQLYHAITDPQVYAFALIQVCTTLPAGGIGAYASILVKSFGFSTWETQLLQMPIGIVMLTVMLTSAWADRKFKQTILIMMIGLLPTIAGVVVLISQPFHHDKRVGRLIAYYIIYSFWTCSGLALSLVSRNVAGQTKKSAVIASNFVFWAVGNAVGPQCFRDKDAPRYFLALSIILGCFVLLELVLISLRTYYIWVNKRQDAKVASGEVVDDVNFAHAFEDIADNSFEEILLMPSESTAPEGLPPSVASRPPESPTATTRYRPLPTEFQDEPRTTPDSNDPQLETNTDESGSKFLASEDDAGSVGVCVKEPTKAVCSNSRLFAIGNFCLLHLPAISITLALAALYFKEVQWPYGHPTAGELNMLQFAAKAHESLIVVSLTDILFHRIRSGLLREDGGGIPLGFLSSPFQLASPIQYLFSWELWGTVLNPTACRRFHLVTAVLIILLTSIGLGASPFSAILMIPQQSWWRFSRAPHYHDGVPLVDLSRFISQSKENLLYEMEPRFTSPPASMHCMEYTDERFCNEQHVERFLEALLFVSGEPPFTPSQRNVSVSRYGSMIDERSITFSIDSEPWLNSTTAIATSPLHVVAYPLSHSSVGDSAPDVDLAALIFKSRPDPSSKMEKWKQPLVAVSCSEAVKFPSLEDGAMSFSFQGGFHGNFSLDLDLDPQLSSLKDTPPIKNDTTIYNGKNSSMSDYYAPDPFLLDLHDQAPVPISAALLFLPLVFVSPSDRLPHDRQSPYDQRASNLCIVQARWVEADVWVSGESSPVALTDIGIPPSERAAFLHQTSNRSNVIRMSDTWLKHIGTAKLNGEDTMKQNTSLVNLAYRQAMDFCSYRDTSLWPLNCIPQFIATYLTDALSTMYWGYESHLVSPGTQDIVVKQEYFKHVYAYSFRSGTSIIVALAILLLHCVIVVLHTAIIVLSPSPWFGSGWGSFGQLMTLALRSRAPDGLRNVGGGVSSSHTWRTMVTVRELADEQRLEMVLSSPNGAREAEGLMRRVEPKVKYS